jgi:hypothetical protein
MLEFILGIVATLVFLFVFGAIAINERDDYRTQKAKGTQSHEVWKKEEKK